MTSAAIAIAYRSGSRIQSCSNADTSPSIGASTQRSPVCGSVEDATSAIPRYGTAVARRTANRRRSPRRETATSPASADDASRPENAAIAIVNANSSSSTSGVPAICAGSLSTSGSSSSARPSTTTRSCRPRSATTANAARSQRREPAPRMLTQATYMITPIARISSGAPSANSSQKIAM